MAAYVAAPIAARNVTAALDALRRRRPALGTRAAVATACACVGVALASPTIGAQTFGVGVVPGAFPVRAAEYLRAIGFKGRLYNEMGAGGYLEWALDLPVFQDGRGFADPRDFRDVMPEPVDPARMARLDARYGFDALIIRTEIPPGLDERLVEKVRAGRDGLADRRTWALVAFDDGGALYLRREAYLQRAVEDEFLVATPGAPIPEQRLGDPGFADALGTELDRAVREAPGCVRCRIDLASLELATDDRPSARAAAVLASLRTVRWPQFRPSIDALLALDAFHRDDLAAGEKHFRAAIRQAADPAPLRRMLAALLIAHGRDEDARDLVERNLSAERAGGDLELAAALARRRGDGEGAAVLDREAKAAFRREWARDRLEVSGALLREGRAREALAAVREAVEADPQSEAARAELDRLLRDAGQVP
jgi:tetratricopeptide (TPR) repeat protein